MSRRLPVWFLAATATVALGGACHDDRKPTAGKAPITAFDQATQDRMRLAASTSPAVLALTGNRALRMVRVTPSNISDQYRFAQVALELVDGPSALTGAWPHAVIDNPARCETCKLHGPVRWRYETDQATHTVTGLLVAIDLDTSNVREILPVPDRNAPAPAPGSN